MGQATRAAGRRNGVAAYKQALMNLAQAPRWRGLIIGTVSFLLVLWIWQANSDPNAPGSKLYSKISGRPQHQDFMWKPPSVLEPSEFTLDLEAGKSSTAPSGLKKGNPQFHLLIHAPKITTNVCRSLLSSFLLDYPTPTLIGYRPSPPNETHEGDFWQDYGLADTAKYLTQQGRISDDDFIAVVDGESTIFQLPSEALLTEYNAQVKKANAELDSKYHDIPVKTSNKQKLQRFNQSVFFAAEYEMVSQSRSFLSRFRLPEKKQATHLNNNLAIGSGSGLRHLFTTAAEQNTRIERTDRETFNTIFAQQALLRASMAKEQREFKAWLSRNVLPSNNKLKIKLAEDLVEARQDLGMGLDYRATMFQTIPAAAQHVADTVVALIDYPTFPIPEIFQKLRSPFTLHSSTPHLNSTSAVLVQKHNNTLPYTSHWADIPLFTNPKTQQVPSLISMLPPKEESSSSSGLLTAPDTNMRELWESMWFYPYARTLLKQYLHKSTSKEVASEAAVGGERWYDARGGRGGVWTVGNEWLEAGELCAPFGKEIFEDGLRGWMEPVPDGVELSSVEKTPDGKGIVIGEQVRNGQIHKIVAVAAGQ
ncbi:hypothetical protein M438DRAFT_341580 [Aureobasidium pullulans EXF-150]|uniref:Uncharacterized protein n=1 Tax=Aureobasidium pullulans EXF-150 TaxID=1043002 RepID=A0A074Y1P2_AURPU|nr:uncharacterized protein M438DRAFT_341580 [Aureobasidium pullulans EXF-150]KEQ89859.1 hypothetical protein M438DRAFT_341580 [Aureobasidium pullulans EXF-150]